MIYQVRYYYGGACNGYAYFGNKKEALKSIKEHTQKFTQEEYEKNGWEGNCDHSAELWDEFETPKTKKRVLWALNVYGGHKDNG